MKVSLHIREDRNYTNFRSEAYARGLEAAGCEIVTLDRHQFPPPDAELIIQTGFSPSKAIHHALTKGIPYIVAECPCFRHLPGMNNDTWVSWGYGGLMSGAYHTPTPTQELWKPELKPMKTEGPTIIFGQKPNDRSLRCHDHSRWLSVQLETYPEAEFRPHPLMVKPDDLDRLEPIAKALTRCHIAVTYTSTAGAEALLEGCVSYPQHKSSGAYNIVDREQWNHDISWRHFTVEMASSQRVGRHILAGYEEARARAQAGLQEKPRKKIMENMSKYYCTDERVTRWQ